MPLYRYTDTWTFLFGQPRSEFIKKRSPLPPFAERAKRSWPGGSDSQALPSGAVTGGCGSRCPRAPFQLAPRSSCFCRSALGVRLGVRGGGPPNFRASEPGALPLGRSIIPPQSHPRRQEDDRVWLTLGFRSGACPDATPRRWRQRARSSTLCSSTPTLPPQRCVRGLAGTACAAS